MSSSPNHSPHSPPTVAYVAGYGRSGSTLLDRLLGSHPAVFSTGELAQLIRKDDHSVRICGCGESVALCPVWSVVIREAGLSPTDLGATPRQRRVAALDPDLNRRLFESLGRLTSAEVVVDSSKTSVRGAARPTLLRRAGLDVRLIHLIRDGRAVAWSSVKAAERRAARPLPPAARLRAVARAAIGWSAANAAAWLATRRFTGDRSTLLTYDAMTSDPDGTTRRLQSWLGLDPVDRIDAANLNTHQMGGNRMRGKPISQVRKDDAWRTGLSRLERTCYWFLAWPCAAWYRRQARLQRETPVR